VKKLFVVLLLLLLLGTVPGEAGGRSVRAYFNGMEATVSGVVLRPGEEFTIDLDITPDNESYAYAEIDEPGTVRAYDRVRGDDLVPASFKSCNASEGARFRWVLAANGRWVDGTAPVNIYYQINSPGGNDIAASGYFTVVDAYIAAGAPTAVPCAADEKAGQAPGPGALIALAGILVATLIRRTGP
jgi:sarcinarray family protein